MVWDADTLAEDALQQALDSGDTGIVGGRRYPCTRITLRETDLMVQLGGVVEDHKISLKFPKARLKTAPAKGTTLTYDSTTWRVLATAETPDAAEWITHLGNQF